MYKSRFLEGKLIDKLENNKILIITGARQVGKSTLIMKLKEIINKKTYPNFYLTLEDIEIRDLLDQHPGKLFELIGKRSEKTFVFIDEIQYLNDPTNFLKYLYDMYMDKIKLIVTGSSAFYIDKKFKDSLVGRKELFTLYPLNFREFLNFKGKDNLNLLVNNGNNIGNVKKLLPYYYEYITYGGYPECVLLNSFDEKKQYLKEIIRTYVQKDIVDSGVEEEKKFLFMLKILSDQVGQLVNINELSNFLDLSTTTISKYLYIMEKSYHTGLIRPFFGNNIRKEITKMPKIYFFDMGLRNSLLNNFEAFDLKVDKGQALENIVFIQLLNKFDFEDIKFWRTQNKNEVDFVCDEKFAYEVKINKKKFNSKQYSLFQNKYSNIKFNLVDLNDSMFF